MINMTHWRVSAVERNLDSSSEQQMPNYRRFKTFVESFGRYTGSVSAPPPLEIGHAFTILYNIFDTSTNIVAEQRVARTIR